MRFRIRASLSNGLDRRAQYWDTDGGPPHPQPLSRKGRGGKICTGCVVLQLVTTPARLLPTSLWRHSPMSPLPSPLAGEGPGVRGPFGASARIAHRHLMAGLSAAALLLASSIATRGAEPTKSPGAIVPAAVALGRPVDFEKD